MTTRILHADGETFEPDTRYHSGGTGARDSDGNRLGSHMPSVPPAMASGARRRRREAAPATESTAVTDDDATE